jgi:hypothetical protein
LEIGLEGNLSKNKQFVLLPLNFDCSKLMIVKRWLRFTHEPSVKQHQKEIGMTQEILDWVPLTRWNKHFGYPTLGTMRNIVSRRKDNGAEEFLSVINGRFYINVQAFRAWISKQGEKNEEKRTK